MTRYEEHLRQVQSEIQSALDKLKAGMHGGPHRVVTLTNSEGTILYRLHIEELGIKHRQSKYELQR